jgi:uncharacterized protein (DUF1501 family)
MSHSLLSRRTLLRQGVGACALPLSGWLPALAADTGDHPSRQRSCILLWLNGGPSTLDLWDPKPDHANGGPTKAIATSVPGLRFSQHLPRLAQQAQHLAVIRSMSTREGDHGRGAFLMRTGNLPLGPIQYPRLGALLACELRDPAAELPGYISIMPPPPSPGTLLFASAGFLAPRFAPLVLGEGANRDDLAPDDVLQVPGLRRPAEVDAATLDSRLGLLRELDEGFGKGRPGIVTAGHRTTVEQASRLMAPQAAAAFRLTDEPARVRDRYGRNLFGQGCLLARRLIERAVPFVEVSLDGWDSHVENFETVARLGGLLDVAWSALLTDLAERGLLDRTLIVGLGEFGRTPRINSASGRDHYPTAWSAVLAGGGIKAGQAFGRTSKDGTTVETRPVSAIDLLATICQALGIDYSKQNLSNVGRPIRIVDKAANPVREVLA